VLSHLGSHTFHYKLCKGCSRVKQVEKKCAPERVSDLGFARMEAATVKDQVKEYL